MKTLISTLMILLAAMLLAACQPAADRAVNIDQQDTGKVATVPADGTVNVSEQDAGKTITLKTGDILIVSLDGNITTGFNWIPALEQPALLEQIGEPQVTPTSDLPGAPGKIVLRFKATSIGQTVLHLDYKRSWEKNTAPEKQFEVKVIVN